MSGVFWRSFWGSACRRDPPGTLAAHPVRIYSALPAGALGKKYQKIWTAYGSPLLDLSERLRSELISTLAKNMLAPLSVELGMLYSKPSVPEALGAPLAFDDAAPLRDGLCDPFQSGIGKASCP